MGSVEVRPFRRDDREQLATLVNAHVGAVLPGVSVSVNTVLSQLEREPAERVTDRWVVERRTLVAAEDGALSAAAHLLRFGAGDEVGDDYRGAAEIRWLVCRRSSPLAGAALLSACQETMTAWAPSRRYADGALPSLATYGVPTCWPHVRTLYTDAGFACRGRVEVILVAAVADLPRLADSPLAGTRLVRTVGDCGTRFTCMTGGVAGGFIEVETDMTGGGTRSRFAGWADIGTLEVPEQDARGIGTHLVAAAAEWLRLGRIERVLAYAWPEERSLLELLAATGFTELVRTERGFRMD